MKLEKQDAVMLRTLADKIEMLNRDERKQEVITEFCQLSGLVGQYFSNQYGYDCFCSEQASHWPENFQYENRILEFIKDAIQEKMTRDGKPPSRWSIGVRPVPCIFFLDKCGEAQSVLRFCSDECRGIFQPEHSDREIYNMERKEYGTEAKPGVTGERCNTCGAEL